VAIGFSIIGLPYGVLLGVAATFLTMILHRRRITFSRAHPRLRPVHRLAAPAAALAVYLIVQLLKGSSSTQNHG
jgi:hypothetical protein